ncbi:MAG: hypothetical protein ACTSRP_01965 [Candidatus Helarchaeota archaeon]
MQSFDWNAPSDTSTNWVAEIQNNFRSIFTCLAGPTEPDLASMNVPSDERYGILWYDTSNSQLKIYDADTGWEVVTTQIFRHPIVFSVPGTYIVESLSITQDTLMTHSLRIYGHMETDHSIGFYGGRLYTHANDPYDIGSISIENESSVTVVGIGTDWDSSMEGSTIRTQGGDRTIASVVNATTIVVEFANWSYGYFGSEYVIEDHRNNIIFENIKFYGEPDGVFLNLIGGNYIFINCEFNGYGNANGVRLSNIKNCIFKNCRFYHCATAIEVVSGYQVSVLGCVFGGNNLDISMNSAGTLLEVIGNRFEDSSSGFNITDGRAKIVGNSIMLLENFGALTNALLSGNIIYVTKGPLCNQCLIYGNEFSEGYVPTYGSDFQYPTERYYLKLGNKNIVYGNEFKIGAMVTTSLVISGSDNMIFNNKEGY